MFQNVEVTRSASFFVEEIMASAARWVVKDGKIFCVFPPVREGGKEIICPARAELTTDAKMAKFGGFGLKVAMIAGRERIELRERGSLDRGSERVRGDYICSYPKYEVELDGQLVTYEIEAPRLRRLTPEAEARAAEQRKIVEAQQAKQAKKEAVRARLANELLELVRAKLADEALLRGVAEHLRFSYHNKLWQRKDKREKMVRELLYASTRFFRVDGDTEEEINVVFVSSRDLSSAEIEEVRLRLWAVCEQIRAEKKAAWLAARPRQ